MLRFMAESTMNKTLPRHKVECGTVGMRPDKGVPGFTLRRFMSEHNVLTMNRVACRCLDFHKLTIAKWNFKFLSNRLSRPSCAIYRLFFDLAGQVSNNTTKFSHS